MAYRNIFISSCVKLSLKNNQLVVATPDTYTIPVEDISCVLIENEQTTLTSALLSFLSENGVAVFVCDKKHLPCGVLLPYNSHSRKLKIINSQIDFKVTVKKQLWQSLVQNKIENQAHVLKLLRLDGYNQILEIAKKVKLDDVDNMEAVAASQYFKLLFGSSFSRSDECLINARLNYGYAILRGAICRSLAVYGFEPSLGLHHKSQLNAFNLADDVIEPFRPIVDLLVYQMPENKIDSLETCDKQQLFNLLNCNVKISGKLQAVSYAVELVVQSLQSGMLQQKNMLTGLQIIPLEQHSYE